MTDELHNAYKEVIKEYREYIDLLKEQIRCLESQNEILKALVESYQRKANT